MEGAIKGKKTSHKIMERVKGVVDELRRNGKQPGLGIIRLGEDPDDLYYENNIKKNARKVGVKVKVMEKPCHITTDELIEEIERMNRDDTISGIIIFQPLPGHINKDQVANSIDPLKDVDCIHPLNLMKIFQGDLTGFIPCTSKAVIDILIHNNVSLEGKNVVIINRSLVVGKPLAMMFLEKDATVTICHSKTKDLHKLTKEADLVVTGIGKPAYFDDKYFNENSIVIDVGMEKDESGSMAGDVDYDKVYPKVKAITPVPGGIGSITTSILLDQVVKACK